jgi:phosphoglycerate dehydrogenase-like enzyme
MQDDHVQLPSPIERQKGDIALPETVSVLISNPYSRQQIEAISSVDPRVRVLPVYSPTESSSSEEWPKAEGAELDALLSQADVMLGFIVSADWLDKMPRLKWLQLSSAGADRVIKAGIFNKMPDLLLTTSSGIHEIPISEHIVASILHFSRRFYRAVHNQPLHKWERVTADEAYDHTVCFVGYGPIARRAAVLCKALGMRSVAVRASLLEQQPGFEAVERFYPLSDLNKAIAEADYVVIAAPHTPASDKMKGPAQFAAMKSSAVLVNISRGALVDETALTKALEEGKIAGASLDVFEQEPLPESSPLWDLPNVLITPHNAGSNPSYDKRVVELFCDNLGRYLRGEMLRNQVIKERGY